VKWHGVVPRTKEDVRVCLHVTYNRLPLRTYDDYSDIDQVEPHTHTHTHTHTQFLEVFHTFFDKSLDNPAALKSKVVTGNPNILSEKNFARPYSSQDEQQKHYKTRHRKSPKIAHFWQFSDE